ncbi:hypothetical protein CAPTEDRAFT_204112 [Capitella teleta]|uniref:Uncharacterized protein n=1 Tax=Capitella teleta TaxID=283909 RepID=R7UVT6_CAPTE|nr:hypothetical protein CAPTEDRAFT_204112 [Capitella teleta]|eukprot:ELU07501.1 hypothetical protein CAPTEDRAFT_204112 [Capitella teleta]
MRMSGMYDISDHNMLLTLFEFMVFSTVISDAATVSPFLPPGLTMQTLHFCFTQSTSSLGISCGLNEVIVASESLCGHSDTISINSCPQDNADCRVALKVPLVTCQGTRYCLLDALKMLNSCRSLLPSRCGGASYVHVEYFCLPLSSSYVLNMCGPPITYTQPGGFIVNGGYPASVGGSEKNCYCSFNHINSSVVQQTQISVDILRAELRGDANLPPCHEKLTSYSSAFILNSRCNEGLFVNERLVRRTVSGTGGPHSIAFVRKGFPSAQQGSVFLTFKSSIAISVECHEVDYDPSLTQFTSITTATTTSTTTATVPPTPPGVSSTRAVSTTQSVPGGKKDPADITVANIGLAVGLVAGALLLILIVVLVVCCLRSPRRSKTPEVEIMKVENGGPYIEHIHHDNATGERPPSPVERSTTPEPLYSQGISPWGLQYIAENDSDTSGQAHNTPSPVFQHTDPTRYTSNEEDSIKSGHGKSRGVAPGYSSESGDSYKVPVPLYAVLEINTAPAHRHMRRESKDDSSSDVSTVRTVMSNYDLAGPFHAEVYLCSGSHSEPMSELSVIDADLYSDSI